MLVEGEPPRLVSSSSEQADRRVTAVREVLAGSTVSEVARRHDVDVAVLHRWVTAFVDAGAAQVTNRPAGDDQRQRDRFLAAFAHETRTPLTTARGWVDVLRQEELSPDLMTRALARLDEALQRLAERARDVELLASASLGLLRPRPVRVTVAELAAAQAIEHVGEDAALLVDPDLVGRLLRDLWSAAQLPPAPAAVALEAHSDGPWADLRVVRRGAPLGHGTLRTLFEPFDLNDDGSGITIGLYLARALAVAHGGTVGVDQDEQSTTFWVRVPGLSSTEELP